MAEGKEPSFGWLVITRAWFAAWAFFESKLRDALVFLILFMAGGAAYYELYGFPAAKEQVVPVLIFTIGPIVALWVLLFIWHLWLAPAALAYEAARTAADATKRENTTTASPAPNVPREKAVNWAIWKQKEYYDLKEFSAILAKVEPARDGNSPERSGFLRLLQDDAVGRKIRLTRDRRAESYYEPDLWPTYFNITKGDAIKWAEAKGFDVSHIV